MGEKRSFQVAFVVTNSDKWRRMRQSEKGTAAPSRTLAQGNTRQYTHKTCLENNTRARDQNRRARPAETPKHRSIL